MTTPAATEPAIVFENVQIGFDEGEVLRGVDFQVARRETAVLLGETGTGKTLLLKMAAGLVRPDSGRLVVLGRDLAAMSEREMLHLRRNIGFVFQEGALFDSLTVEENVAFRLREERVAEQEIAPRVREALQFVEMEDAIAKLPGELSGGMRRRVAIARALVTSPPIVLYDSPTAGLDPVTSQKIITLILRLRDLQGVTSLVATQRMQDAFALANFQFDPATGRVVRAQSNGAPEGPITRFLVLREGRVYFDGDQHQLRNTNDPYLEQFLE
jgi:phospholipid/cholesterol/gamma-HCH transport system ATP-binding protein